MIALKAEVALPRPGERLRLGRTLAGAYGILGRRILAFIASTVLLAAATDGPAYLVTWWLGDDTPEALVDAIDSAANMGGLILGGIISVVMGIVWFRTILLGEPHRLRSYLRFGRRGLRYLGIDILISGLMAVPLFVLGIAAAISILSSADGDMDWIDSYSGPAIAIAFVWIAVCSAWLGLAYPAIATDGCASGSLRLSIQLTRGQRLPLFFAFLLGATLWDIAAIGMLFALPDTATEWGWGDFIGTLLTSASTFCFIAVSAVAYRQLQGRSLADLAGAFD